MKLLQILRHHSITIRELAVGIGLSRSATGNKVYGLRPWFQHEIDTVLAFLSERLGRPVTYEEAFAPHPALPAVVNE